MEQIDPEQWKVQAWREASKVERCHTLPHHGTYTVGQHSFDMLLILLALHPDPSKELMKAVVFHDLPERFTGDTPSPTLTSDGELAKAYSRMETKIKARMGLEANLTDQDRFWLKGLDKLELLLWAKDQVAMGNQNAHAIIGNLVSWFQHNKIPIELVGFIQDHKWTRIPNEPPK